MPVMHNRDEFNGKGPKSLSEGLKQGKQSSKGKHTSLSEGLGQKPTRSSAKPKSLASQLIGGGKNKRGGITINGVDDIKTDITFPGADKMEKRTSKKKKD